MWKILIPCICNTAPKEEILELATLFHGHFKDYKILIARLRPAETKSKSQTSKRLRAEKWFANCLKATHLRMPSMNEIVLKIHVLSAKLT